MVVTDAGVKFEGEVKAEVIAHDKQDKIRVLKYKAKKHSKKQQGHRQPFTTLKVTAIA
jgi:large subunit ribosomal protein L21